MKLKVKPNSPRTEILEETKEYIKLAVKGKPEKGEANSEVVRFLSKHFGKEVRIIRGLKSRNKIIEMEEPELRPEFIAEMKKVAKEKVIHIGSFKELRKKLVKS